jgi:hypothetical protein
LWSAASSLAVAASVEMTKVIELLAENHAVILEWARALTPGQMVQWDFGGFINGQIKTPLETKYEGMPELVREVFSRPEIRQVVHVDIKPFGGIPRHTHLDMSHYRLNEYGRPEFFPYKGDFYKVTHFTLAVPADSASAFMFLKERKHHWQVGKFDEFDVISNWHYVVNNTAEHLRFLYIEFYPEPDKAPQPDSSRTP